MLDISSLKNAVAQLADALELYHSPESANDTRLQLHLRAASIQAFEFTYELSVKTLKRFLEMTEINPALPAEMSFNEIIRRGYARGLLSSEIRRWKEFRKDRGTTSHTYSAEKAQSIVGTLPEFLKEASFLIIELEKRLENET